MPWPGPVTRGREGWLARAAHASSCERATKPGHFLFLTGLAALPGLRLRPVHDSSSSEAARGCRVSSLQTLLSGEIFLLELSYLLLFWQNLPFANTHSCTYFILFYFILFYFIYF